MGSPQCVCEASEFAQREHCCAMAPGCVSAGVGVGAASFDDANLPRIASDSLAPAAPLDEELLHGRVEPGIKTRTSRRPCPPGHGAGPLAEPAPSGAAMLAHRAASCIVAEAAPDLREGEANRGLRQPRARSCGVAMGCDDHVSCLVAASPLVAATSWVAPVPSDARLHGLWWSQGLR